jgi:hypothetical protein
VRDAVASVLAPTAGDLKLIVIDDGSADATRELLAAVKGRRLRVTRQARGTGAREVDTAGREVALIRHPEDDAALRRMLIRRNPFVHSSIMMRRALVERAGGYDETLPVAQDYDLWIRMSRLARLANLPEPLVVRRLLPGRVTAVREAERLRAEARVRWRAVWSGVYPWWCALFAARPALALALPPAWRRALRRVSRRAGAPRRV